MLLHFYPFVYSFVVYELNNLNRTPLRVFFCVGGNEFMERTYLCLNKTIARTVENPGIAIVEPKTILKKVKKVRGGYVAEYNGYPIKIHNDSWKNFRKYSEPTMIIDGLKDKINEQE